MKRAAILCALVLSGCGSSSTGGGVTVPKVQPAAQFALEHFTPTGTVRPGQPVTISFSIKMPDGKTLTSFRTGPGPHTGVHLIIVRDDLGEIIHQHPPVEPTGAFTQKVTFPAPGPYRVLVDVYPDLPGALPNFQLLGNVTVAGAYHPVKLPPYSPNLDIDGYRFHMLSHPAVHAIQAEFLHVDVTTPAGQAGQFRPLVRRARTRDLLPPGLA